MELEEGAAAEFSPDNKESLEFIVSSNALMADARQSDEKDEAASNISSDVRAESDVKDQNIPTGDDYLKLETVALDVQEDVTNIVLPDESKAAFNIPEDEVTTKNTDDQQATVSDSKEEKTPLPVASANNTITKHPNGASEEENSFLDTGKVIENTCELKAQDSDSEQPSLTKYFTNVPPETTALIDPSAEDFFNSVSSDVSPMMKSVAGVAMLKTDAINSQIANNMGSPSDASFTIGESIDITEDLQENDKIAANDTSRKSSLAEEQSSSRKASADYEDKPNLSKFFAEEMIGDDVEGKAFFDALAGITTTGSAVILGSHQPDNDKNICANRNTNPFLQLSPQETTTVNHDEDEYYYDIWIPSDKTQKILNTALQASPGTYFAEKDQLTMPGVIFDDDLEDPIKAFLAEVSPDEVIDREVLMADSVSQDDAGLRKLMSLGYYNASINLTTRLLTSVGQGPGQGGHPSRNTPYTLQLWFTRIALFMQLRKFSQAEVESEVFNQLDQPDLYYEFYPDVYKGRKGSMVSFSFRMLLAELPQYQGNHQKSLDKLYLILEIVHTILDKLRNGPYEDILPEKSDAVRKAAISLWEQRECRVLYSLVNCSISFKDYVLAVNQMQLLLEKDKDHQLQLYSAFGRLYLQLGDVKTAQECFSQAAMLRSSLPKEVTYEVDELIDKAMMAIAQNAYADAYNFYKQAYTLQPNKPMLLNNMAICLLYMGKLKESLALLEKTVQGNPPMCLHDGIIFNICTLYELESSQSNIRKQNMLHLVAKHAPDNFNTWCLKMQQSR